jgi:hypothetical protein
MFPLGQYINELAGAAGTVKNQNDRTQHRKADTFAFSQPIPANTDEISASDFAEPGSTKEYNPL